jgi:hypothetical protein
LGASGLTYTVPDDGYFITDFVSVLSGADWVLWEVNGAWFKCQNSIGVSTHMAADIPVKKGDVVKISYYSTKPTTSQFIFKYAEGNKP